MESPPIENLQNVRRQIKKNEQEDKNDLPNSHIATKLFFR